MLSSGRLILQAEDTRYGSRTVIFKSSKWEGAGIQFDPHSYNDMKILRVRRLGSEIQYVDIKDLRSLPREDQEAEAWRVVANAH